MGYHYAFRFSKTGDMIYISHLDLLRLFGRAARRAGLALALTQGFHPHFKLKLKRALKLGLASENEEGDFELCEKIAVPELRERLQAQLPEGIKIKEISEC